MIKLGVLGHALVLLHIVGVLTVDTQMGEDTWVDLKGIVLLPDCLGLLGV